MTTATASIASQRVGGACQLAADPVPAFPCVPFLFSGFMSGSRGSEGAGSWDSGALTQAADRPRSSGFTRPSFFNCSSDSRIVGSLTPGRAPRTSAILKICGACSSTYSRTRTCFCSCRPSTCRTRPAARSPREPSGSFVFLLFLQSGQFPVPSAFLSSGGGSGLRECWSGRQDLNLRPLRPERGPEFAAVTLSTGGGTLSTRGGVPSVFLLGAPRSKGGPHHFWCGPLACGIAGRGDRI